jgi:hypothetical protein
MVFKSTLGLRRSHVLQLALRDHSSQHFADDPVFALRINCGACRMASTQHFAELVALLRRSNLRSIFGMILVDRILNS